MPPNNRNRLRRNTYSRQIFTFILAVLLTVYRCFLGMCGRNTTAEVRAAHTPCMYNQHPYRNTASNRQRYFLSKPKRFEEQMTDGNDNGFVIPLIVVTEYEGDASKPYNTALAVVDETKALAKPPPSKHTDGIKNTVSPQKSHSIKTRSARNNGGRSKPTSQTDKSITPRPPLTPKTNPKTRVQQISTKKGRRFSEAENVWRAVKAQQDRKFAPAIPPRLPPNVPTALKLSTRKPLKNYSAKDAEMMKAYLASVMGIALFFMLFM